MQQYASHCVAAALGLFSGYLLGYLNHGLASRREANERRRKFREEIRLLVPELEKCNLHTFLAAYDASVEKVRSACIRVMDDIRWSKRGRFERDRDEYCGFKHEDLLLPTHNCGPLELTERMKQNGASYKQKRAELARRLNELAQDAV